MSMVPWLPGQTWALCVNSYCGNLISRQSNSVETQEHGHLRCKWNTWLPKPQQYLLVEFQRLLNFIQRCPRCCFTCLQIFKSAKPSNSRQNIPWAASSSAPSSSCQELLQRLWSSLRKQLPIAQTWRLRHGGRWWKLGSRKFSGDSKKNCFFACLCSFSGLPVEMEISYLPRPVS